MNKLYLSKRNIATLLEKLDGVRDGETSTCTIIKNDTAHPVYTQTVRRVAVTAAETQDAYVNGVSPRLQLSRPTLMSLMDRIEQQSDGALQFDDLDVFAIPDEKYYGEPGEAKVAPVGDLTSAFIRSRGKQN